MKKMKKYTRVSLLALLCGIFAILLCFSVSAVEIDEENPNIEPYIMNIEGLHSSVSAINTLISGSSRLATFYINDFNAFTEYVNSLNWSNYNDLPQLMGLRGQAITNIKRSYYTNVDNFISLIGAFGQLKYVQAQNVSLNTQIDILEERLTYKDLDIQALNIEIANLQSDKESLQNDIISLVAEIEALETEIDALDYTINGLREYNANAYNDGYNDGMTNAEVFKGGLITIFSAPLYVFGEAFNFEIFGVNIFSIIQFIITISIAYCVIKFIR